MTNIKALCIAGGFGTRLEAAGLEIPKGLIESGDTTILGRMLADIKGCNGIESLAMVTNAKFYQVYKDWLERNGYLGKLTLLNNGVMDSEARLGAIGDIIYALNNLEWWKNTDLLVMPSDTLYKFKIQEFMDFAKDKKGLVTVVNELSKEVIANRLGCAGIDGNRIVNFEEKPADPKYSYAIVPFYFYSENVLNNLIKYKEDGGKLDAPSSIISWFVTNHIPVYAFKVKSETLDVGMPVDIPNAKKF